MNRILSLLFIFSTLTVHANETEKVHVGERLQTKIRKINLVDGDTEKHFLILQNTRLEKLHPEQGQVEKIKVGNIVIYPENNTAEEVNRIEATLLEIIQSGYYQTEYNGLLPVKQYSVTIYSADNKLDLAELLRMPLSSQQNISHLKMGRIEIEVKGDNALTDHKSEIVYFGQIIHP